MVNPEDERPPVDPEKATSTLFKTDVNHDPCHLCLVEDEFIKVEVQLREEVHGTNADGSVKYVEICQRCIATMSLAVIKHHRGL
mgnify:CR=1 FL=1